MAHHCPTRNVRSGCLKVFCQGFRGQLFMALNGLVLATIELRIWNPCHGGFLRQRGKNMLQNKCRRPTSTERNLDEHEYWISFHQPNWLSHLGLDYWATSYSNLSSEISYFHLPKQQTHPFHKASHWGNESNLHLPLKLFVQLKQNMNQHCTGRQANQSVQWGFNSLKFYISKWLPKRSEDTCPMALALLCSTSSYPQLSVPRCYWRDWANPVAISLSTPGWCNFPGQQLHLATAPCQVTKWGLSHMAHMGGKPGQWWFSYVRHICI